MKLLVASIILQCICAQSNDTRYEEAAYDIYEDSIVRAEKSIALYREIVKKALYCKFVQSKKTKYTFRFKKTAMDVTWHVKNGCNAKRTRRAVDIEAINANDDRYFYKVGPKGRVMFDYDEFDNEGYGVIDEEIDQALFQFFVSDYEEQERFLSCYYNHDIF